MRQAFLNGRKVHAPKWGIESELFCFLWRRRCKTLQTKKTQKLKAASLTACLALARFYYHLWRILENGCGPVHIDTQLAQCKQGGSRNSTIANSTGALYGFRCRGLQGPQHTISTKQIPTNATLNLFAWAFNAFSLSLKGRIRTPTTTEHSWIFSSPHTSQASRLEI